MQIQLILQNRNYYRFWMNRLGRAFSQKIEFLGEHVLFDQ